MTAIIQYTPTGDPYLDSVLSGVKWATNSLTFSFPNNAAFYGSFYGSGQPYIRPVATGLVDDAVGVLNDIGVVAPAAKRK